MKRDPTGEAADGARSGAPTGATLSVSSDAPADAATDALTDALTDAPTDASGGATARMIPSTLIYVRRGAETLMLRKARGHQRGKWNGLGGKAEPGEMPEACARREVREEAGLEVERLDYRGLIVFPRFDGTNDWYVWIYLASARGEPRAGDEGDLAWVATERLSELDVHAGDRVFLPWLDRRDVVFSARFDYRDGAFAGHEVVFYPRG